MLFIFLYLLGKDEMKWIEIAGGVFLKKSGEH